jgi:uncharacterized repeat protein (TIGR01451 family)
MKTSPSMLFGAALLAAAISFPGCVNQDANTTTGTGMGAGPTPPRTGTSGMGAGSGMAGTATTGTATTGPGSTGTATTRPVASNAGAGLAGGGGDTSGGGARMQAAPGTVYFPTGTANGAVLALAKEVTTQEAIVGVPFEYKIKLTNVTGNSLDGVKITESLDPGFNLESSTPNGARTGNVLAFDIGSLAPNESKTIVLKGTGAKAGVINNCSSVAYNVASCFTVKITQPSLAVTKTMSPETCLTCDEITAKIVVTNSGSGVARDVKVSDNLPAGLVTADGRAALNWDVGALNPGQSKEFDVKLKASKPGSYTNEANAMAAGGLNAKSKAVSVTVKQPAVTITAECPQGTQQLGRQGTFKFTVKNTSDVECTGTNVTAMVGPADFVSADNGGTNAAGKLTWSVGKLAAGESKVVSATYRLLTAGQVNAQASVSCRCAEVANANCSTAVQGVADIGSLLTDTAGVTPVGAPQVYTCEVENQGQVDLTDVTVVATWPAELQWVSHTAATKPTEGSNMATWNFGTVKQKQKVMWTFTLKATKAGEFKIHTSTSAKEIKNKMEQDEITTFVD